MKPTKYLFAIALLTLSSSTACGGGNEEEPPPTASGGSCERDLAALDAAPECFKDDNCPCGSYCRAGVCAADCTSDDECGVDGESCNLTGLCVADGRPEWGRPLQVDPVGNLTVNETTLSFPSVGSDRVVIVRSQDGALAPFRAAVSEGFGIRCEPGGDWLSECSFDELDTAESGPLTLFVRTFEEPATALGAEGELRLFAGRQFERVGLRGVDPNVQVDTTTRAQALIAADGGSGIYEGTATLVRAGLALDDTRPNDFATRYRTPVEVSVTAVVNSTAGSPNGFIRFTDGSDALFGAGGTTAELVELDGSSQLLIAPRAWLGDPETGGLWVQTPDGADRIEVRVREDQGAVTGLGFNLPMSVRGATTQAAAIELTWDVELTLVADCESEGGCELPTEADVALVTVDDVAARAAGALSYETFIEDFARTNDCPNGGTACRGWTTWVENLVCSSASLELIALADSETSMSATGDLGCVDPNGGAPTAMPTVGLYGPSLSWEPTRLSKCLDDLSGDPAADAICVDTDRIVAAAVQALEADRNRGLGDAVSPNNVEEVKQTALGHRLLQQLLGVCGFVANQATSSELAPIDPAIAAAVEDPVRAVAVCGEIGDLLLHPRVAVPLSVATPEFLSEPDYRALIVAGGDFSNSEAQLALPVSMASFVERQSDLLTGLIRDARNGRVPPLEDPVTARTRVTEQVRQTNRRHLVMLALANSMYERARAKCAPDACAWEADWVRARDAAGLAFNRVSEELERLRLGQNELGITELDLPLYRVGEEVSASERFYAVSDYLLGDPDSAAPGVAEDLLDDALEALDEAQSSYVENLQNKVIAEVSRQDQVRRINGINVKYGERVASLCGDPDMVPATILGPDDAFDQDPNCWVKKECLCELVTDEDGNRSCAGGTTGKLNAVGEDTRSKAVVGEKLCRIYNFYVPRSGTPYSLDDSDEWIEDMSDVFAFSEFDRSRPFEFVYRRGSAQFEVSFLEDASLGSSAATITESMSYSDLEELVENTTDIYYDSGCRLAADATRAATAAFALEGPGGIADCRTEADGQPVCGCGKGDDDVRECPPGFGCDMEYGVDGFDGGCVESEPRATADDRNDCFQGEIGEAALSVDSAKLDIDIARARMDELYELFLNSTRSCIIQNAGADAQASLLEQHNDTLDALEEEKAVWDTVAAAGGVITGTLANDDLFNAKGKAQVKVSSASGGLAAVGGLLSFAGQAGSIEAQRQIEASEREYEAMAAALAAETELEVCLNEANAIMIGLRSTSLELQRAVNDLARAYTEFENLENELNAAWLEGEDQLARENSLRRPVLDFDFWLDDKIETFTRTMRAARRAAFLAVVAVEYEFQASTGEQINVLAARHPDELREVLERLRTLSLTGQVAGSSPNNGLVVVSMVDDIQHLSSASISDANRCDRFRNQLRPAARNGVQGQVLDFELSANPLSNSGDEFELFGPLSCAERLWSVNASIVSKPGVDLVTGADPTGKAQVFLRKQNAFKSRWCGDGPQGRAELQEAAFRPGVNLFTDAQTPAGSASPGTGSVGDGYTTATVDARFDLSRVDLEDEAYFNGDSQELAGRGLYGSYELFLPNQIFASTSGEGVNLDAICDVLLRFDYVSATRN